MSQSGRGQIETALTIAACANHPSAAVNFPHDPLKEGVGTHFLPVLVSKSIARQGLIDVFLDQFSGPDEPFLVSR